MFAENEKVVTSLGLQPVLEKIKQDIAAISTDGYVTTEALNSILQGYLTEVPAEYVTEDELTAKGYLTAVPEEFVTDEELTAKGFLTAADVPAATSDELLVLYNGTTEPQA